MCFHCLLCRPDGVVCTLWFFQGYAMNMTLWQRQRSIIWVPSNSEIRQAIYHGNPYARTCYCRCLLTGLHLSLEKEEVSMFSFCATSVRLNHVRCWIYYLHLITYQDSRWQTFPRSMFLWFFLCDVHPVQYIIRWKKLVFHGKTAVVDAKNMFYPLVN